MIVALNAVFIDAGAVELSIYVHPSPAELEAQGQLTPSTTV